MLIISFLPVNANVNANENLLDFVNAKFGLDCVNAN